ncbi:VOC family protein [Luteitalea sp. TBR-22]|uniref:VOC family protein n=1 Tax=Luteitalea sp. TBR-22 TaxID=2802971 RepID=UPI001EF52619|nr:glyoxalase/bleomycin resistance/extradiol dioxygenase family protein [Luteitalea sp. TBR-22]
MSLRSVTPYLHFSGNAAQAIALYVDALGATVEFRQQYKDVPGGQFTAEQGEQIMHATLNIGGSQLMLSDAYPGLQVAPGTNMNVAVHYTDTSIVEAQFAKLAEGGRVETPLQDTFWGARFGQLVDRFGISWMFNAELPAR